MLFRSVAYTISTACRQTVTPSNRQAVYPLRRQPSGRQHVAVLEGGFSAQGQPPAGELLPDREHQAGNQIRLVLLEIPLPVNPASCGVREWEG